MKTREQRSLAALGMAAMGGGLVAVVVAAVGLGVGVSTRAQTGDLYLVPSNAVPWWGNFYSIQRTNWPPLPCNTYSELDIYTFSDTPGHYWYDDRAVDYVALARQRELEQALWELEYPTSPEWPEEGPQGYGEGVLWLSIAQLTNGMAPVTIHGTVQDVLYEVQSEAGVTDSAWAAEVWVLGAANQDWTAAEVSVGERTNSLFFRAESLTGYDGYGVAWGWYGQHGLYPVSPSTGAQDADGDGLLNWQEYRWGSDPVTGEGFSVWVSSPAGYSGMP